MEHKAEVNQNTSTYVYSETPTKKQQQENLRHKN